MYRMFLAATVAALLAGGPAMAQSTTAPPVQPLPAQAAQAQPGAKPADTRTKEIRSDGTVILGDQKRLEDELEAAKAKAAGLVQERDLLKDQLKDAEIEAVRKAGVRGYEGFDIRGVDDIVHGKRYRFGETGDVYLKTNLIAGSTVKCDQRRRLNGEDMKVAVELANALNADAQKLAAANYAAVKDGRQPSKYATMAFVAAATSKSHAFKFAVDAMACGAVGKVAAAQ